MCQVLEAIVQDNLPDPPHLQLGLEFSPQVRKCLTFKFRLGSNIKDDGGV